MYEKKANGIYCIIIAIIVMVVSIFTLSEITLKDWGRITCDKENISFSEGIVWAEKTFKEGIWRRYDWINLSGLFSRACGVRSLYKNDNVNVGTNGYIFGAYIKTSADYEFEQIESFKEWLDEKEIEFLYVNEPIKYLNDMETLQQFGQLSYGNDNANRLLQRLDKSGISTLDLRECILDEELSSWDLFYRTDHHWTVPAGLWASRHIVKSMGEHGFNIDMTLYEYDKFSYEKYKNAWLGEQGRRVAASYIGFDDYTFIEPKYKTSMNLYKENILKAKGDFGILIDKSRFDTEADPYSAGSWHYGYMPSGISGTKILNNNIDTGKVLYLGDSYDQVVIPFLALGVREVDSYILRNTQVSVRDIVKAGDYDMVIMAYAQLDIGAHDDPDNVNYRMYDLE